MNDETNLLNGIPEGDGTTPPPIASADDWNRQLAQRQLGTAQAETTSVRRDPALTVQPSVKPVPAKEPGWGTKLWDFAKHTTAAVARGVTDAADNLSNTDVALGAGIVHGAIKAARKTGVVDSHFGSDWEQWYNAGHIAEINPIQVGEDNKDAMFGEKRDGFYGFVENASDFATGYLLTAGALKGVGMGVKAAEAAGAGKKAIAGIRAAQGAVTDAAFMDPYQARLSNLVQNAPPAIQQPISALFQAHDDDNEAVARVKSALEGLMTGAAIDRLVSVVKFLRPAGAAASEVKLTPKAAEAAQSAADVATTAAKTEDAVVVQPVGDGTFKLEQVKPSGDPAKAAAIESPVFHTAADAESHAASLNEVAADNALPKGTVTPDVATSVLSKMNDVRDALNGKLTQAELDERGLTGVRDMASDPVKLSEWITNGLNLNVSFTQSEPELNAMVSELANKFQEAFVGARGRQSEGLGTTFADLHAGALKLAQEGDPNSWGHSGFKDAETLRDITSRQMARRVIGNSLAKTTYRLARAFDANPENVIARDNFTQSMTHMLNLGTGQEAVASESGRLLGSHRAAALGEAAGAVIRNGSEAPVSATVKADAGEALTEVRQARAAVEEAAQAAEDGAGKSSPKWQQLMPDAKTAQLARAWNRAKSTVASAVKDHPELQSWEDEMAAHDKLFEDALNQSKSAGGNASPGGVMKDVPGAALADRKPAHELLNTLMGVLDQTDAKLAGLQRGTKKAAAKAPKEVTDIIRLAKKAGAVKEGEAAAPTYMHDVLEGISPEDIQLARERMQNEAIIAKAGKKPADVERFDVQGPRTAEQAATLEDMRREIVAKAKAQRENPLVASGADREAAKAATAPAPRSDMERAMDAILEEPSNYPEPHRIGNAEVSPLQPSRPRAEDPVRDLLTRGDMRGLARQIVLNEGDPALMIDAMLGNARIAKDPTGWEKFNAYRANAMLSGPRTFLVNAISNAVAAVQMPTEYWLAGAGSGNTALKRQGWEMGIGLFHNWRSAWQGFKKAWSTGENALDQAASQVGDSGQSISQTSNSWLASVAKAPSRLLMATDEFFKNLNYLNAVRGLSVRKSIEQGVTDPGEIAGRLADDLKTSVTQDGRALNPIALNYARTATYQAPLEYGLGQSWQTLVQSHPALRVITPFVRTPVNLARFAWQRTPVLGLLQKQMRDDLAAGGERAALAASKQSIGAAVWGTAAWYAANGGMTGRGPSDPALRKQWADAGHEPYSIRIPGTDNKWVSYRRLDPLGTALGIVADIATMSGEMHGSDIDDSAVKFMAALSADVTSKTFLSSLSDFMSAMSSGDPNDWKQLAYNLEGSVMPMGSLLRQANPDDHWREVRNHVDNIASRLPGFSESLEPRRNILGKMTMKPPGYLNAAFNPFTVTFGANVNSMQDELVQLGKSMPMPSTKIDGVDLTDRDTWKPKSGKNQSPYDRWLELVDKPKYGQSLEEQLGQIMQTDAWKHATSGTEYYPGGLKYALASKVITNAYSVAKATMLQEYPELNKQLMGQNIAQKASLASDSLVQKVETQFGVKH